MKKFNTPRDDLFVELIEWVGGVKILAEQLDMAEKSLYRLRSEENDPSIDTLFKIHAFGYSWEEIMTKIFYKRVG